jgi:hypothetical protein
MRKMRMPRSEPCESLSANCSFFLVFQSAPWGFRFTGYLTFLEPSALSCYLVEGFPSLRTIRYVTCERVHLAMNEPGSSSPPLAHVIQPHLIAPLVAGA